MKSNRHFGIKKHPGNSPPQGTVNQQFRNQKHPSNPPPQESVKRSWKRPVLLALTALVALVATWAFCELVLWSTVPPELVGKWVVTEGPQEGATFDFYRKGAMVGRVNAAGNEAIVNARIRVEDKKIYSTTRNPQTKQEDTMVLTIHTLAPTALVVEGQGQVLKMERVDLTFWEVITHFLSL